MLRILEIHNAMQETASRQIFFNTSRYISGLMSRENIIFNHLKLGTSIVYTWPSNFRFTITLFQNTTVGIRQNCLLYYVLETVISRPNVSLRVWEKGKDREFVATSKKRSGKQWVTHYMDHPLSKFFGWVIFEEWWGRP